MPSYAFEVEFLPAEGGAVRVVCPSFRDCVAEGATADEALQTLRDALALWSACIDA